MGILATLAVAGCGGSVAVVQAPTTTIALTVPTTSDPAVAVEDAPITTDLPAPATTTATSNSTLPTAGRGTLILALGPVGDVTLSADQSAIAISRLQQRATNLGYDASATLTADGTLQVTIRGVAPADQENVATQIITSSGQVYLRPVLVDSRFGLPCVVGPKRPAPTSDTGVTTTIVGLTIDTLPDIPAESSGYMSARGGLVCNVGPAGGTGDVFTNAQATVIDGVGWGVTVTLKPGPGGEGVWNTLASRCFNGDATCPTNQLAIELDGVVISAPTVQVPEFHGEVQISGDFTETEARDLAGILNRGTLPAQFVIQASEYIAG